MTPPFVKKFDFRGIYNKDIKDSDAYYLGLALAKTLHLKKVLVGWDTRSSSKNLALNFMSALETKQLDLSYMDMCPIDYVTVAANAFDFDLSVMFTGSHNPWNWTGLLMHTKGGDSIQGELVEEIVKNYYEVQKEPYKNEIFDFSKYPNLFDKTEQTFAEKLTSLIPLHEIKKLNVLVDVGDGSGTRSLALIEKLIPQITVTRIHDRKKYDKDSSHTADPSNPDNMQDLMKEIQKGEYDCGFAFDSDADRMLAVDEEGKYLNGSLVGSAHIQTFHEIGFPSEKFGYAVDCGPSFHNTVVQLNKEKQAQLSVEPIPVGRSLVRKMIRSGEIHFGIENVGHFYTKDFFMTDSGSFSLVVILYWISKYGPLSTIRKVSPDGMREQIFSPATGADVKKDFRDEIQKNLQLSGEVKRIEVDGIRYEFFDNEYISTWYAIRKSGYEAIIKCYFGSVKDEGFTFLESHFKKWLKK